MSAIFRMLADKLETHALGPKECRCGNIRGKPWKIDACDEEGQCDWNMDHGTHSSNFVDPHQCKLDILEAVAILRAIK